MPRGWEDAVRRALDEGAELRDLLDSAFVRHHVHVAALVNALLYGAEISDDDVQLVASELGVSVDQLAERLYPAELEHQEWSDDDPEIVLTTLMSIRRRSASRLICRSTGHR